MRLAHLQYLEGWLSVLVSLFLSSSFIHLFRPRPPILCFPSIAHPIPHRPTSSSRPLHRPSPCPFPLTDTTTHIMAFAAKWEGGDFEITTVDDQKFHVDSKLIEKVR